MDNGPYDHGRFIYQQLHRLPDFDGNYPVIGSWIVGDEPAGICLRGDALLVTTNMSHFVPHYFVAPGHADSPPATALRSP